MSYIRIAIPQWRHQVEWHPGRQLRVSPLYFLLKNLTTFLVASSLYFSPEKLTTFFLITVIFLFHSPVPLGVCHHAPFLPISPCFPTILCKFAHKKFLCHPPGGLRANIDWKSAFLLERGQFGPKIQVPGVVPTNHCSCRKTRINDPSYGTRMWTQVSFVCHNPRIWQTDERTDRQTAFSWLYRALYYVRSHGKNQANKS